MSEGRIQQIFSAPVVVFSLIACLATAVSFFSGLVGFDMNANFSKVKPYFQSEAQRCAVGNPDDADRFDEFERPKCLVTAVDHYSATHTNDPSVYAMREALRHNADFYVTLREVYSKLETHNNRVASLVVSLMALFIGALVWIQAVSVERSLLIKQIESSGKKVVKQMEVSAQEIVKQILDYSSSGTPSGASTADAQKVLESVKTNRPDTK